MLTFHSFNRSLRSLLPYWIVYDNKRDGRNVLSGKGMNSCGTWNHGMLDLQSISSMIPSTTRIYSLSQEDKDSIFQHGILVYNLVSNRPSSLSFHPFPTSQPLSHLASSTTFSRKSGLHVKSPNFHWSIHFYPPKRVHLMRKVSCVSGPLVYWWLLNRPTPIAQGSKRL